MDDAEDEEDPIVFDRVEHDPVVPDPEALERVARTVDRLDRPGTHGAAPAELIGEPQQRHPDASLNLSGELLERGDRGGRELDSIGGQARLSRVVVRPAA